MTPDDILHFFPGLRKSSLTRADKKRHLLSLGLDSERVELILRELYPLEESSSGTTSEKTPS